MLTGVPIEDEDLIERGRSVLFHPAYQLPGRRSPFFSLDVI